MPTHLSTDEDAFAKKIADELAPLVDDGDLEIIAAFAALFISLIALIAATLGVVQQYFASASGYNHLDHKVMGGWSASRVRKLKLKDFRFEVRYETPVIFLCRPDYDGHGPVDGSAVVKLQGDDGSREQSYTQEEGDAHGDADARKSGLSWRARKAQATARKQKEIDAIHTADNDLATWVTLLKTIQSMESKSNEWQNNWFTRYPPKTGASLLNEKEKLAVHQKQTIVVAMQKKRKSYDTMPAGIKKPYATTTWCHLIELLALLGVYWVKFDRTTDRYRAEGNGFVVTGEKVPDLGVMFSFQVARGSRFEENRTIPSEHIKDLAFGKVSTVYSRPTGTNDRRLNNNERQDIGMLQFSNRSEIAESLVLIGCNTNTVNYFARDDNNNKRTTHLFPLAFEIIGMLSKTFHIENSGFRYLPNPTMYAWNPKNFSLRDILRGYLEQMKAPRILANRRSPIVRSLRHQGERILCHIHEEQNAVWPSFVLLDALHNALQVTDTILTGADPVGARPSMPSREATQYSADLSRKPSPPAKNSEKLDVEPETAEQQTRRTLVQDVLRSHIQEVLSGLNQPSRSRSGPDAARTSKPDQAWAERDKLPRFEDIDSATPEEKQGKLMQVYFRVIREAVIKNTATVNKSNAPAVKRRRESIAAEYTGAKPPMLGIKRSSTMTAVVHATEVCDDDDDNNEEEDGEEPEGETETSDTSSQEDSVSELTQSASTEDIWCTLVFRMICWLMLHDFNKMDVQVPKTELHGSRLRVYIA